MLIYFPGNKEVDQTLLVDQGQVRMGVIKQGKRWDMEGESQKRDEWSWRAFGEQCGNLVQQKLLEIYECDLNEEYW